MAEMTDIRNRTMPAAERRSQLIAAARDMVPALRERAARTEEMRRIPDETIRDLMDAGIFRTLRPARAGGYELDYGPIQLDVAGELGRGCGSTAWVASVIACHDWILGMFPPEAQDDVWGASRDALVVSALAPERVDVAREGDGYVIAGRWKFASGVDACDWAILGGLVADGTGPPEHRWFLVPRSDYAVDHDTWFAAGLRGTGSKDIIVERAFVPAHRSLATAPLKGDPSPGSAVNPCHLYRLPLFAVFPFNLCAPAIGIARGMIEAYVDRAGTQDSRYSGARVAAFPSVQIRVSESAAEIDCAELLYRRDAEELNRLAREGKPIPLLDRMRYRRNLGYAGLLCMRAVDRINAILGAHGLDEDGVEQRAFRDVHAANAQIGLQWDVNAPGYAQMLLGLEPTDKRI